MQLWHRLLWQWYILWRYRWMQRITLTLPHKCNLHQQCWVIWVCMQTWPFWKWNSLYWLVSLLIDYLWYIGGPDPLNPLGYEGFKVQFLVLVLLLWLILVLHQTFSQTLEKYKFLYNFQPFKNSGFHSEICMKNVNQITKCPAKRLFWWINLTKMVLNSFSCIKPHFS